MKQVRLLSRLPLTQTGQSSKCQLGATVSAYRLTIDLPFLLLKPSRLASCAYYFHHRTNSLLYSTDFDKSLLPFCPFTLLPCCPFALFLTAVRL